MAAPCQRIMAGRSVQFWCRFRRTAAAGSVRRFSVCSARRAGAGAGSEPAGSGWTLAAAAVLQRLPVLSARLDPVEERFRRMMLQMELEKSLLSDHELRLLEDAERMSRKQADDYDSDEEGGRGDQEIMLGQDLEDTWEQKLKGFQPAPRDTAGVDGDATSAERCLAETLVLLARQPVGGEKLWLLPQAQWRGGETLRQTAERALAALPAGFTASFLGNAPCGVYKYKLPRALRTESSAGLKVFFFKAVLAAGAPAQTPDAPLVWARKSELQQYLKPEYRAKVDRLVLSV
ncbi:39S ribosomal protein L46, mitochondrial [Cololabis saira]|uniref:39S ribosomal protein L46, mitochondrial n=1 Tax=Cololabis saira TaxID=129043 RepID=UPI002AD4992E|nr:39S ribosomal protein L46, mitochondrial [Cololabis saira]